MPQIIIVLAVIFAVILLVFFLLASFIKVDLEYDDGDVFVNVKYLWFTLFKLPQSKKMLRKKKKKENKENKKREREQKRREMLRKKRLKGQHLKSKRENAHSVNGTSTQPLMKPSPTEKSRQTDNREKTKTAVSESRSSQKNDVNISKKANNQRDKEKKSNKPDFQAIINGIKSAKPYVKRVFKKICIYNVFVEVVVGCDDAAKTAVSYGVHCAAVNGLMCFLKNNVNFKYKKIDIKADFDLEKTDYYAYCKIKLRLSTFLYCLLWGYSSVIKDLKKDAKRAQEDKSKENQKKAA